MHLVLAAVCLGLLPFAGGPLSGQDKRKLPSFLEEFKSITDPEIIVREIRVPDDAGALAYLARPDTKEKLPGVLLIGGGDGREAWYRLSAREISSVGYVVLAVDGTHDLNKLRAAIRWLKKRDDVFPDRIGVVGWGRGGEGALALAVAERLQACVTCDGYLADDSIAKMRTPVLGVFSRPDDGKGRQIVSFRKALARVRVPAKVFQFAGVKEGFMGPPGSAAYSEKEAEEAWLEIYEFLGKNVEDAKASDSSTPVAGIADIMRAVNSPTGLRGLLVRALEKEPRDEAAWKQARALAALVAEGAGILERLTPPRGEKKQWQEHAGSFRDAAEKIVRGADRRDFQAARQALDGLGNRCAACHKYHR